MHRRAFLNKLAALSAAGAMAQGSTLAASPSVDGTIGRTVTDALGSVFSLGTRKDGVYQTLRNGSHLLGGYGYAAGYLYFQGTVYAFTRDAWFRWGGDDQGWKYDVPRDPRDILLMAKNARTGKTELTLQGAVENAQPKDTILITRQRQRRGAARKHRTLRKRKGTCLVQGARHEAEDQDAR